MMSESSAVDCRQDKLEEDNHRLKLTVGALLLVLAAVPLVGALMPQQIPDVIADASASGQGGSSASQASCNVQPSIMVHTSEIIFVFFSK